MYTLGLTQEAFITALEVKLNADYTDEQKNLISHFGDGPIFCFADPGTGKTYTAIGGLLNAELFKGIPGENIYALSFTRLATGELAVRNEVACNKCGTHKYVNFSTLHSLCRTILKENHRKLGMLRFDTSGELTMEKAYSLVSANLEEWGVILEPKKIRSIIRACRSLNSSLVFDEDTLITKMAFKECNVEYELFDKIRGLLFAYSLLTETISVSDLLLYTLILLMKFPEVSAAFKEKCKLLLVDEAQDLSLLQLKVISMLTDNPVLIGDMKQQIYGFNGACQEVVEEFHKLYPNCTDLKLTQSFRCKNEIADYATKIIRSNNVGGEDFKGTGPGGKVIIHNSMIDDDCNLQDLCSLLHQDYVANKNRFTQEYLFLVRTNISLIPIMEELFKQGLPFRANNFVKAFEVPVISELCELLQLCEAPTNYNNIMALRYLLPEFRGYYNLYNHPLFTVCKNSGCSVFEVNYQFKNPVLAATAMNLLLEVQTMLKNGDSVGNMFNKLWPLYEENWLSYSAWKLEAKPDYYICAVKALTHKNYSQFYQDEIKKANIVSESEKYARGVRCYTMHASKGLEADIVYILDADEGLIPNESKLRDMLKKKCDVDAARAIREERSLCYVACTRAKEELHIVYNQKPAEMLLGNNPYAAYDSIYEYYKTTGDDIRAFTRFVDEYVQV